MVFYIGLFCVVLIWVIMLYSNNQWKHVKIRSASKKNDSKEMMINVFKDELNKAPLEYINEYGIKIQTANKLIDFHLERVGFDHQYYIVLDGYKMKIKKDLYKSLKKMCKDKIDEIMRIKALNNLVNIKPIPQVEKVNPDIRSMFHDNLEEFKSYIDEEKIGKKDERS